MSPQLRRLVGAVLIRTLQDLGSDEHRPEAQAFIRSAMFEAMVEAVGMDPYMMRRQALAGQLDRSHFRAAYR